jgi:hypothetical protein
MASFSFPPLGKEKIQWTARPLGHAQMENILDLGKLCINYSFFMR